ncbi:MAG: hypothetical protein HKN91_00025 [Acidimicrobiia bacterium]|nr:hypothetical protein [Acidimicrobiia bacterium]
MIIDCNECAMQHTSACSDCVVNVLLHKMGEPVVLSGEEHQALGNLADAGMVAPLRLVPLSESAQTPEGGEAAAS